MLDIIMQLIEAHILNMKTLASVLSTRKKKDTNTSLYAAVLLNNGSPITDQRGEQQRPLDELQCRYYTAGLLYSTQTFSSYRIEVIVELMEQ